MSCLRNCEGTLLALKDEDSLDVHLADVDGNPIAAVLRGAAVK
jgi:hypothetical protein